EGVLLDQLIDVALEQAELDHSLGQDAHRLLMQSLDGLSRTGGADAGVRRGQDELVACALRGVELAGSRKRPRHVGGVEIVLGSFRRRSSWTISPGSSMRGGALTPARARARRVRKRRAINASNCASSPPTR